MANPFYFEGGLSASNTQELEAILLQASDEQYQQHVKDNNFANWVRHELGNELLAQRLAQCRTTQQVLDILRIEHLPKQEVKKKPAPTKPAAVVEEEKKPLDASHPSRSPIRDLRPPKDESFSSSQESDEQMTPPEMPGSTPPKPEPIAHEGFLDRYNAKEFVIGLCIGVVLGVLLYALVLAL